MARHWNYRVIKTKEGYQIHEVYYDEHDVPISVTEKPDVPFGLTKQELKDAMKDYQRALLRPTLKENEDGSLTELNNL